MDALVPTAAEAITAIENEIDVVKSIVVQLSNFDGSRRARIIKMAVEFASELP